MRDFRPSAIVASSHAPVTPIRALVLHGVWNPRLMVWPVVRYLRQRGIHAGAFGYSSILSDPRASLARLRQVIVQDRINALVGYSLGGMLSVLAVHDWSDCPIRRIVCLGSPLNGSATARWLADHHLPILLGGSRSVLCDGAGRAAPMTDQLRIGMVAGIRPLGIGRVLGVQGRRSDGTVAVAETRWAGLADHCRVRCSHTGLPAHMAALGQMHAFLITGSFVRAAYPVSAIS